MHQPETGLETSGSAGIAAALAVGHRQGLLPVAAREMPGERSGPWTDF